jgi:3',5'-nucleoside bisphosphate phosphatase
VDTVAELQQLAAEKQLPVLAAVEMGTSWKGELTDVLCYGFDPTKNALHPFAQDITRRQRENTREVYENLVRKEISFPNPQELGALLEKLSAQQSHELVALLQKLGYGAGEETSLGK